MEKRENSLAEELTDVVGKRLDENTDGDALARAAHYSRSHFQRVFREETGETPGSCRRRLMPVRRLPLRQFSER